MATSHPTDQPAREFLPSRSHDPVGQLSPIVASELILVDYNQYRNSKGYQQQAHARTVGKVLVDAALASDGKSGFSETRFCAGRPGFASFPATRSSRAQGSSAARTTSGLLVKKPLAG